MTGQPAFQTGEGTTLPNSPCGGTEVPGTDGGTRTHTGHVLSVLSLPFGIRRLGYVESQGLISSPFTCC